MGAAVPQVITSDRASGSQFIDGSLKFDKSKTQFLEKTFSSVGNRKTWTYSAWFKRGTTPSSNNLWAAYNGTFSGLDNFGQNYWDAADGRFVLYQNGGAQYTSTARHRDHSGGWYHLVISCDVTQSSYADRYKVYVNNFLNTSSGGTIDQNTDLAFSNNIKHYIGTHNGGATELLDGNLSQVYFIDGQALGPEYFGFTDPLTDTWKPKKYSGTFTQSSPNNGTTWSGQVTGSFYAGSYDQTEMFDGSLSSVAQSTGATWTTNIPFTTLRIYGQIYGAGSRSISVNGTDVTSQLGGNGDARAWHTITGVSSPLTSIQWDGTSYSGATPDLIGLSAIEIDGEILIDGLNNTGVNSFYLPMDGNSPIGEDKSGRGNNWTPINFGGSVALDNPQVSGARPILNTTQGGSQAGVGVFGSLESKFYTVTTANGSVYQFDITSGNNPSLEFIRGATYRFDYTSHASHPLRFSSTNPDSSTTAYTEGTNTSVSNVITITVPHDAPDTLYYYCTAHASAMNGAISVTTDNTKADQYASNCVLALPLIGVANDVSTSIGCTSTTKTTAVTNAVASNIASNFYRGSYYFDGSGDYINVTAQSELSLQGDFTIECWTYIDTNVSNGKQISSLGYYVSGKDGNWYFGLSSASGYEIVFYSYDGQSNGEYVNADLDAPQTDKWYHIAAVRIGTTVTLYVDGVSKASGTISKGLDNGGVDGLTLGRLSQNGGSGAYGSLNGYIQDLRIYNGVGKYTSDFIVPATSPDILPDTPSGVSGGSKLAKITDGAVAFDGTGDYLRIAATSDFDQSTGTDFTAEAYIYMTAASGPSHIFGFQVDGNNRCSFYFTDGTTTLNWYTNLSGSGSNKISTPSNYVSLNAWHHVAVTRSGSTSYLFVDGIQQGTSTTTDYPSGNQLLDIGTYNASGYNPDDFPGFISNVRYIKGTALYTSNFTPPSEPLTNVTNTKLLCCQKPAEAPIGFTTITASGHLPILNTNDTGITTTSGTRSDANSSSLVLALPLLNNANDLSADIKGSGSNKTMTVVGDAAATSSSSQYYGGSFEFDGTGDRVTAPAGADFAFGTGDFTIETWMNFSTVSSSADHVIVDFRPTNGDYTDTFTFSTDTNNGFKIYTNTSLALGGDAPTVGKWHHIALVRDGGALQVFLDGIGAGSVSSGHAGNDFSRNGAFKIGGLADGIASFTGYQSDVRIYKGVAKYTSNFTPVGTFTRNQFAVSPGAIDANGDSAANTFNPFNTDINTVRGQETGYATLNPLYPNPNGNSPSDGNLKQTTTSGNGQYNATMAIPQTGSWYWEVTKEGTNSTGIIGISNPVLSMPSHNANNVGAFSWYIAGPRKQTSGVDSNYGGSVAQGDVVGVAYKSDIRELRFYLNGVDQGVAFDASSIGVAEYFPAFSAGSSSNTFTFSVNFGQKPFKFPPPDGFQPLNAANVRPVNVISRPDQYVGVTTYTGNGSTISIDVGHEPDFLWIKNRDDTSQGAHRLFDTVRGSNKTLYTSFDLAEAEVANSLNSFNSNGFTVGSGNWVNGTDDKMVAWSWKAGGSKGTFNKDGVSYATAADAGLPTQSGSGGGISVSACSVGTKQGFSIIKYGGGGNGENGIPHGLGRVPKFYIVKNITSGSSYWTMYHASLGNTKGIYFDTDAANTNDWWDNTTPTEDLFYVKQASLYVHNGSDTYISYLWCDVPGLQKFGSFTGNNSTNGAFVELGFRAKLIIYKVNQNSHNWMIFDSERDKDNPCSASLRANLNNNESSFSALDITSTGFKFRNTDTNPSGAEIIYMAWAEAPSIDLYGGGANAR